MPTARRVLTADEARRFIAERCLQTSAERAIGLELEFLSFSGERITRPSADALGRIASSPLATGGRVTCEPGGQLEVSSPPRPTVGDAISVARADAEELRTRADAEGIDVIAVGADRWREPERVIDSCRYRTMEAHFDAFGPAGRLMMCNTAALQINIDGDLDTWRAANAIGPAMVAAFANSPDDSGVRSTRMTTWLALDPQRAAVVEGPLPDGWVRFALAAPVLVARAGDDCIPLPTAIPLAQWIAEGSPIGYPTLDDVAYHLTMLFPPVRPRGWLEIRYLDALPSPWWEVAVRTVTSLVALPLRDVMRAVGDTSLLWHEAARDALDDVRLAAAADRCFALALAHAPDAGVADYAERYVARRMPAWA